MALPRVLIIGPLPPPVGGMAQVAQDCIESCRRSGRFEPVSVDVRRHPGRKLGKLNLANLLGQLRLGLRLRRELALPGTALAHLHASVGTPLTVLKNLQLAGQVRKAGLPLLLHPHSGRMEELLAAARKAPGSDAGRWRGLMDSLMRSADAIVVMSPGWREMLAREWPAAKLMLLESGIDTQLYAPSAEGWASPAHVLSMGQLAAHKGTSELALAWRSVQADPANAGLRLDVLGEARDDEGRALAAQLGALPGVQLHGVVTGAPKIALLQAARLFVLPSHYENLPVALLEAMACGCACIATSVGAVPEVLAGGAGLSVPPRDPAALSANLRMLLSDEPRCRALAAAGRARVLERYSQAGFDRQLGELYAGFARLNRG
jgi:glycosyltransferase involved in cell wall biosynthesis